MRPVTLSQHRHTVLPREGTFLNLGEASISLGAVPERAGQNGAAIGTSREKQTAAGASRERLVRVMEMFCRLGWQVSADSTTLPSVLCISERAANGFGCLRGAEHLGAKTHPPADQE